MSDERSLEMDALTAHLDRGWDLLQRGDLVAARVSAHHILKISADSPEGHTLLGAIAAAEGDPDEAMDLFRQAMDLDPEYLDAVLYAAELAIHPLGDWEQALELCEEAEQLAADPEEELDVVLLRAEALLSAGREVDAAKAARQIPPRPFPAPAYYLRAGRVMLETGDTQQAIELLRQALGHPDSLADAHYYLGLAQESLGESDEALEHFFQVAALDRMQPDPAWAFSKDDFEQVVRESLQQLSRQLVGQLDGVPLRVLDHPGLELIAEGFDPRGTVFLAGAAGPEDEEADGPGETERAGQARPSCIFVYKRPLERLARSSSEIPREVLAALEHEALLFLGLEGESTQPTAKA